ncbi:MAG TPA: prolyl oligopeptidase family serine peptidase [Candidatus Limnocylindria bacterium]|nr:prolyl oligopeptidase family serine peptidase [Candidatus Limnocylindria bacterium]
MDPAIPPVPATPREDVADTYFGDTVTDPYRWLEDAQSPRVAEWTDAQNARTRAVLDALPERKAIASRLRELLSVGLLGTPRPVAGRIFHLRREGAQAQAVLYVRDGVGGADRPLVDPNELDRSGLLTIDWYYPSPDGRLVAIGLSRGGTEMSTLHVRDVASGRDLGIAIPHTQRSQVAWAGEGFYYVAHPEPGTVPPGDEHYHRRVRYHELSEAPPGGRADPIVFGEGRAKEDIVGVQTSPDGRWVLLSAFRGWVTNDLYLLDREHPERGLAVVVEGEDGLSSGQLDRDGIWIRTNLGAPNYRIVHAQFDRPREWRDVIPEGDHSIEEFDLTRDRILVHRLERATSRLALWRRDGQHEREIELPALGAVTPSVPGSGISADAESELACFAFQSFALSPRAYALDTASGRTTPLVATAQPALRAPVVVDQTTYRSKDGTAIPMFLVHRADVAPTGDVPTVLTGYGGFNVARVPTYTAGAILWAERGGVYALANLRGGSEFGERWHRAGMLANKQNVFDDLHAGAEHLAAVGWTRRGRVGAFGGSNGGLLMGAAITQRPDLYGAIVCTVPLLDMLRYQHLLIARFWIAEYGSSEDPVQYRWLRAYSPYHNVREGERYPAVLFTTAEGDSRVDPMHARKMAALLQAHPGAELVLLRVDRDAGHGVGKPLSKQVDDLADIWSFLGWRLGGTVGA